MIAKKTPANKNRKLPPEPLTKAEVDLLLKACAKETRTAARHQALIVLLWRAQLRVCEVLGDRDTGKPPLLPAHIDFAACKIHILHGKGDKDRTAGIDPIALAVVRRWLDERARRDIPVGAPLICTLDGRQAMSDAQVRELFARLGKQAGIAKRVHPHGLRHTGAFELLAEGVDVVQIQEQLGHADLATTYRYLRHHAPEQRIGTMRARKW